jgi:hypothetical protein
MITEKLRLCLISKRNFVGLGDVRIKGLCANIINTPMKTLYDCDEESYYIIKEPIDEALEDYYLYDDVLQRLVCDEKCVRCGENIVDDILKLPIPIQKYYLDNIEKYEKFICCGCYRDLSYEELF